MGTDTKKETKVSGIGRGVEEGSQFLDIMLQLAKPVVAESVGLEIEEIFNSKENQPGRGFAIYENALLKLNDQLDSDTDIARAMKASIVSKINMLREKEENYYIEVKRLEIKLHIRRGNVYRLGQLYMKDLNKLLADENGL